MSKHCSRKGAKKAGARPSCEFLGVMCREPRANFVGGLIVQFCRSWFPAGELIGYPNREAKSTRDHLSATLRSTLASTPICYGRVICSCRDIKCNRFQKTERHARRIAVVKFVDGCAKSARAVIRRRSRRPNLAPAKAGLKLSRHRRSPYRYQHAPTSTIRRLGCCTYMELRYPQRVWIVFRQIRLEIPLDVVTDPKLCEEIDHP